MLQIIDWDKYYETRSSRRIDHCANANIPNRQKGLGFLRVLKHPRGLEIFAVFILLVELCSKQKRPRYGILSNNGAINGKLWGNADIANELNLPIELINCSIEHLCSKHVQWIKLYSAEEVKKIRDMEKSGENLESIFEVLRKCTSMYTSLEHGHVLKKCTSHVHIARTAPCSEEVYISEIDDGKQSTQVTDKEQHDENMQNCESVKSSENPSETTKSSEEVYIWERGNQGGTIGGIKGRESNLLLELEENKENYPKGVVPERKDKISEIALKRSYELFVKYYNMLHEETGNTKALKATLRWSDQRARKWAARCRESNFRDNNITLLKKAFASDWLMGRMTGRNKTYFILNMDWLIKNNTNYVKILDGYYDNREIKSPKQSLVDKSYD